MRRGASVIFGAMIFMLPTSVEAILEADDLKIKLGSTSVWIWTNLSDTLAKEFSRCEQFSQYFGLRSLTIYKHVKLKLHR